MGRRLQNEYLPDSDLVTPTGVSRSSESPWGRDSPLYRPWVFPLGRLQVPFLEPRLQVWFKVSDPRTKIGREEGGKRERKKWREEGKKEEVTRIFDGLGHDSQVTWYFCYV